MKYVINDWVKENENNGQFFFLQIQTFIPKKNESMRGSYGVCTMYMGVLNN